MRINFAHIRERSTTGGYIDFAVFDAKPGISTDNERGKLLTGLTIRARMLGLKIDKSALAYEENGEIRFYGAA